jgi:hypothetical protein
MVLWQFLVHWSGLPLMTRQQLRCRWTLPDRFRFLRRMQ